MERQKLLTESNVLYFLLLIYTVGVIGHILDILRPVMAELTPFTLLMTCGFILYFFFSADNKQKSILLVVCIYVSTFIIELIGVNTGNIFGSYTYGETLGVKIVETPLIIGVNWIIIILGAKSLTDRFQIGNVVLKSVLGALFCLIFDLVLEQVAPDLGYWFWRNEQIPLQNYVAWFGISLGLLLVSEMTKIKAIPKIAGYIFVLQFLFFIMLYVFEVQLIF